MTEKMKRVAWILIFLAAMLLSAWMIFSDLNLKDDPIAARLALAYYAFQCLGPFWMLYDWFIRRQKRVSQRQYRSKVAGMLAKLARP